MNCSQILPSLFLGAYECLYKKKFDILDVDYIISATPEIETPFIPISYDNNHFRIPITFKMNKEDIKNNIKTVAKIIDNLLRNQKKIYIYCYEGVSRSASCVIYYLYAYKGMTMSQAFDFVKLKRSCINPNDLMLECLKELEQEQ